jgi:hypothetical protein
MDLLAIQVVNMPILKIALIKIACIFYQILSKQIAMNLRFFSKFSVKLILERVLPDTI